MPPGTKAWAAAVLPPARLLIGDSWSDGTGGTYAHVTPTTGRMSDGTVYLPL